MYNQYPKITDISKLGVIVLSIILLTGISFIPVLQAGVYAQQPQPQQKNRIGISQVIKQIAQQVATANPGTNPTHVYQILVQLAKLTASQTSNVSKAIQTIKQIDSQVKSFPKGRVSQALIQIAKQQAAGNTTLVTQVMNQAVQYIRTGVTGANALVQVALQAAAGGTPVLNQQLRQIAQQVANGTGAQQTQILQTLQLIALQISNTDGGGRDKVVQVVKHIHDDVSNNHKGRGSKSIERITKYVFIDARTYNFDSPTYNFYNIGNLIVHNEDPINVLGNVAVQAIVGSPGAVQQLDQITEQVSLETGGDPTQVKDVVQNLALETSIKGGDTQRVIDNIETEVAKPDDSVSKSLSSLATQEKQGNDEAVNTVVDKVAESVVGGNDVAKVVTTAVEDEGTVEGGLTTTTDGTTTDGTTPLDGGTAGAAFDEVVKSVENPETVDSTEQQSSLSGPPPATQDPNLIANPQEDPNLFQLSPSTEQKQTEQTTDETTSEGAAALEGETSTDATTEGGVTAFAGGTTTTTDTETDDGGGGVTALNTDDTDTGNTDTGDDGDSDDDDSSDGDSDDSDDGGRDSK